MQCALLRRPGAGSELCTSGEQPPQVVSQMPNAGSSLRQTAAASNEWQKWVQRRHGPAPPPPPRPSMAWLEESEILPADETNQHASSRSFLQPLPPGHFEAMDICESSSMDTVAGHGKTSDIGSPRGCASNRSHPTMPEWRKPAHISLQAQAAGNRKTKWRRDKNVVAPYDEHRVDECAKKRSASFDPEVVWLFHEEDQPQRSVPPPSMIKALRPDGQDPALKPRCMQLAFEQGWYPEAGDPVITKVEFQADGKSKTALRQGCKGVVESISADGAAVIDFKGIDKKQWVYRGNLSKLEKMKALSHTGLFACC